MNTSGNENRSVRTTKKKLSSTLLALLREKPLNKITVREVAELADVNRGTFYFHYQDVYALVKDMEEQFFHDLQSALELPEAQKSDFLPLCLACMSQHAEFCEVMLGPNGDIAFSEQIKHLVNEKCTQLWLYSIPNIRAERIETLNAFLIGGVISVFQHWLATGQKLSIDELSTFLGHMVRDGISPSIS